MNTYRAQILTPDGPVFEGEVVSLRLPGTNGNFQVLYNHSSLMSTLEIGEAVVQKENGEVELYAISGGFVDVNDNALVLLAEAAERADEINVSRAQAAKERAERKLKDNHIDHTRYEMALRRAVNRLKVARQAGR
ncbi:MAG TPA: ATP synthase F1 subunit epsilon [Balneolales bacterium]|jgi:F-type H+-transporting ATPase subunit epsilon|nr:ATP synthase F1 subunit epsilon [Balneolales bacterium]